MKEKENRERDRERDREDTGNTKWLLPALLALLVLPVLHVAAHG